MKARFLFLVLLTLPLWHCKKQEAAKLPSPSSSQKTLAQPVKSDALDSASLLSMRFLQVLQSQESGAFYTQDDCRCTQATASFTPEGEMTFSVCDVIDSSSRYAIHRMAKTTDGMILYASHGDSADTLVIQRKQTNPDIYEIRRSNIIENEGGNFFLEAKDSAKVEYSNWDCDEYQG